MTRRKKAPTTTQYYAVEAEGHRIGLCCCLRCGAVLLLGDKDFNSPKVHLAWHKDEDEINAMRHEHPDPVYGW